MSTSFNLRAHLENEHKTSHLSTYLKEIVYGGSDGIVTTFAIVAGFAGAQHDPASSSLPILTVILFGMANLFADGFSMGLGSFLSIRANHDVYNNEKNKEATQIQKNPEKEYWETIEILKLKQFSESDAKTIADIYKKNPSYWTDFMMRDEHGLAIPDNEKPVLVAISTFCAFVLFGSIPLMPFIFGLPTNVFALSCIFTILALFLLGVLRSSISKQSLTRSILETILVGSFSALIAFTVGTFFRI
jgi:VIT1/CCC1 family predicted Fe2+/Mn2+ transporter